MILWDVRITYALGIPEMLQGDPVRDLVPPDTDMAVEYAATSTVFHLGVQADAGPQAIARGQLALEDVQKALFTGVAPEGYEAYTIAEADRRAAAAAMPKLASLGDFGRMAGLGKTRTHQLADRADFPRPIDTTAGGAIYREADLLAFLAAWDRTPGRPRTATARQPEDNR
jgi:hypothetical protein